MAALTSRGYIFQVNFPHTPNRDFQLAIRPVPPFSKKAADDIQQYMRDKILAVLADYLSNPAKYLGNHPLTPDNPQIQYIPKRYNVEDLLNTFWDPEEYHIKVFLIPLPVEGPLKDITNLIFPNN